jgi:hypothetical protein
MLSSTTAHLRLPRTLNRARLVQETFPRTENRAGGGQEKESRHGHGCMDWRIALRARDPRTCRFAKAHTPLSTDRPGPNSRPPHFSLDSISTVCPQSATPSVALTLPASRHGQDESHKSRRQEPQRHRRRRFARIHHPSPQTRTSMSPLEANTRPCRFCEVHIWPMMYLPSWHWAED